jgi:hypothetical protein
MGIWRGALACRPKIAAFDTLQNSQDFGKRTFM